MCETQLTEPPCRVETLSDIFLRIRPNIDDVWPEVFGQLKQGSVVVVRGKGKSVMVMDVLARILIRNDESKVLLVDVEQHFNIMKLVEISINLLQKQRNDRDLNQRFVEAQLKRLYMLTCSEEDSEMIPQKLEKILSEDSGISMVLIDSLGFFFYADSCNALEKGKFLNKDVYMASFLKKFKNLARKYEASIVSTIPEFMNVNVKRIELVTNHFITLKRKMDLMSMTIQHKDLKENEILFKIEWYGLHLLQVHDSFNKEKKKQNSASN